MHAYRTISDLANLLQRREVSSVELTTDALGRIEGLDPHLNSFLEITSDVALMQARQADAAIAAGTACPLTGIPMALKDILSTRGIPTTCASRILEGYTPQFNATVVTRLEEQGAVLLGKTNLDEFAMGSSTENSAFGAVRNPWDLDRVPGGSSGGSAACVAAGLATYALGTDTGGSIRQPAAFTGITGLKPTYGRVSRYGLIAFASSLDQIGPLTRSARDAALVLQSIAGIDPLDSTTIDLPVPNYQTFLTGSISGMRFGVPHEYFSSQMDPEIAAVLEDATRILRGMGATLVDVSLTHTRYGLPTYYVIAPAEAMANLARYDGVRYGLSRAEGDIWQLFADTRAAGFGAEVKRRILLGAYALSAGYYDAYYLRAQKIRTLVRQDFDAAFREVDVLLAPSTPSTAFRIGEKTDDPLQMYLSDFYTVPASIAGICAVSIPAGFASGLPVGMQILGKPLDEGVILRVADAFQQETDYHQRTPHGIAEVAA